MKVALVHDFLNQLGGSERVLLELHKIFPNAPVYTLLYDKEKTHGVFDNWQIIPSPLQRQYSKTQNHKKLLPKYPSAIESFNLKGYDLVISQSNSYAKGAITGQNTTHICYCNSPMRYAWDWYHEYLKEQGLGRIRSIIVRLILSQIRLWDSASAKRVDYWIANSKNVQNRIKKYYRQDSKVIYPPTDFSKFHIEKNPEDYYLIVSRLSPYKKVDMAIKAFNKLGKTLLIVGEGPDMERLKKMAKSNIEFAGFRPDSVVKQYYSNCKAFLYPQEEDFGLTAVEAAASGRPLIAYKKGGALEIVNEKNGVFFDKPTADSLAGAVEEFERRENDFNPEEIRQSVEKYSSENFRKEIIGFIEKVMGRKIDE